MDSIRHTHEFLIRGVDPSLLINTLEKPLAVSNDAKSFKIGIPKENNLQESRVPLTPTAVGSLVANGHQVLIEHNAGLSAQYLDKDYSENGALVVYSQKELYNRSDIIVKISPLDANELEYIRNGQILISAVHFGVIQDSYIKKLIEKNVTAIGFEFLQAKDGSIPFMQMMSEIAGISSVHIASELLVGNSGGKGLLLGGITGVPPANVTIIGAGAVGMHACKTAIGLGASVKVIDEEVHKLRELEAFLGQKVFTAVDQLNYIQDAVQSADVLIGAAHRKGYRAPCVVTEDMVASMKEGSVIVDVSIDQGGCIETSRITTHDKPTFVKHGVIHYCVPNIPSRVAGTASAAVSNILRPLLLKIGEAGSIQRLLASDSTIKTGVYVYHKHITQRSLAAMLSMDFMDIELLTAVNL